jgi:hypothetical protein
MAISQVSKTCQGTDGQKNKEHIPVCETFLKALYQTLVHALRHLLSEFGRTKNRKLP